MQPVLDNAGRINGAPGATVGAPVRRAALRTIWFAVLGISLLSASCAAPTVWKAEVRSPDGSWIASARTVQSGGFGTAWITTSVSLSRANSAQRPVEVLAFACDGPVRRPYTLDNKMNVGGTIGLSLRWSAPTHLDVAYDGRKGTVEFQAVRYQGVDISLRDVSDGAATSSSAVDTAHTARGPR